MTEKQIKILNAALQLFAKEGFHATSTSKVAKAAGVSEGLIFRHFKNKEGLLMAILDFGADKFNRLISDIITVKEPKTVIRKTIEMVSNIDVDDFDFWKLQYKLKWELEVSGEEKMRPLHLALTQAFRNLNYEKPEHEAHLLVLFIEGLGSAVLKGSSLDANDMITLLKEKYEV